MACEETHQFPTPTLHPKPEIVFAFTLKSRVKITGLEICMISTAISNMFPVCNTKGNQIILGQSPIYIVTTE